MSKNNKKKSTAKATTTAAATKKKSKREIEAEQELRRLIILITLLALSVIGIMQLGVIGKFIYNLFRFVLGDKFILIVGGFAALEAYHFAKHKKREDVNPKLYIVLGLWSVCFVLYLTLKNPDITKGIEILSAFTEKISIYFSDPNYSTYGGLIGALLASILTALFDKLGSYVVMGALLLSSIILLFSMDEDHSIGDTFSRIFSAPDDYEDDYEDEEEEEIIQTAKPKKTPLQVPVDPVPTPLKHKKGSKSSIFMSADNQGDSTTASSSLSNIKAPVRFDTLEAPASTSISDVPVTGVVYEEVEEPVAVQEKPKEVVQAKPALKERKRGYVHMEENDDIDVTTIERPVLKEPVIIKADIPVQK